MQDDPFLKAAQACFDLGQNYVRKPLLRDISKLDLVVHYQAVCEIVCFLLHLSDRLIFEAAPKSRQFRMDKLVLASLNVFVKEIQDRVPLRNVTQPSDPVDYGANNRIVTREQADEARARIIKAFNREAIESAKAEASELFRYLYGERMREYSAVGNDWFRIVLSKFGRHFCEAVDRGEPSLEVYLDAQAEAVRMHASLVHLAPELFKP